jgi:hypothetical protein
MAKTGPRTASRKDNTETRGAFTITRDEAYVCGSRQVHWVVSGPGANGRAFVARRAARRFCDMNQPASTPIMIFSSEVA